jgi:hypothetical protein
VTATVTVPTDAELVEAQQAVLAAVEEFCDAHDAAVRARDDFAFGVLRAAVMREKAALSALVEARCRMVDLRDAKGGAA